MIAVGSAASKNKKGGANTGISFERGPEGKDGAIVLERFLRPQVKFSGGRLWEETSASLVNGWIKEEFDRNLFDSPKTEMNAKAA